MRFQEVLERLKIDYRESGHEHCRSGWVQLDCPYCSKDSQHFRLGYNLVGGYMHCWACGSKGVVRTLAELSGVKYKLIASMLDGVIPERLPEATTQGRLVVPNGVMNLLKPHRRYLESRRIDPDVVSGVWGVRGISIDPRLPWRLFIPIYHKGEIVSWTTRSIIENHRQRYRSAEASQEKVNHRTLLYGEDYCHHTIVVVEGPLDVWAIGPGAVATFGIGYTRSQLLKMSKYPIRVICFDSEPEAQRRAHQLCSNLEVFPGQTFNIVLETGKDPSDASKKEIHKLRRRFIEVSG